LKIKEVGHIFWPLFPLLRLCIHFGEKQVDLRFGRFFHKLIRPPWLWAKPGTYFVQGLSLQIKRGLFKMATYVHVYFKENDFVFFCYVDIIERTVKK
jgi:hypothetical protein